MSDEENKRILFQSKGAPEFRFLSNFHLCEIKDVFDKKYHSVEHMYQCLKANNEEDWNKVYASRTPADARKNGQSLTLSPRWHDDKDTFMEMCVLMKFSQNKDLQEMLLATDGFELVEFAPWDKQGSYWGVNKEGKGENKLGQILMTVRARLKEAKERDAKKDP